MNDYLDSLKKEALEKDEYVRQIEELSKEFPDLRGASTRWRKHLASKRANALADQVEFRDSCGCCPDSVVYAMPYVERNGFRIYSDPCQIVIGNRFGFYGDGVIEDQDWPEELAELAINSAIILSVKKYLQDHPPREFDEEDD